jgi:hypothetical protein
MSFKDHEYDIIVTEGVAVEVWRGPRVNAAQQFGVEWDGPVHSTINASVWSDPCGVVPAPIEAEYVPPPSPHLSVPQAIAFACIGIVLCAVAVGVIMWGSARGWW